MDKNFYINLQTAGASFENLLLTADTGQLKRLWQWTGSGFATVSLVRHSTGYEWVRVAPSAGADWQLPDGAEPGADAVLIALNGRRVESDPFTSPHLAVVAEIEYPSQRLRVKWELWIYPDAPGLRTQLHAQALEGYGAVTAGREESSAAVERIPATMEGTVRHAVGYYNHTQKRNTPETELLREETWAASDRDAAEVVECDWASLFGLRQGEEALYLVKESHKCVNQTGYDTGSFETAATGVTVTGWGLAPGDVLPERYRSGWATWCIASHGNEDEERWALKVFERHRYPIDPGRDLYIMANTWGSTTSSIEGRHAAREDSVLSEIESCADLGIEVLQIDDGWQSAPGADSWKVERWEPHPERYPHGWSRVRQAAQDQGVTLGLWAAYVISAEELIRNCEQGGFRYFKIDFAVLNTYDKLESTVRNARELIEASGHRVRINWDVTENPPRVGYFFAKELGNIYLENRKPEKPDSVVYIPHLVLRDAWHVAAYTNLNKFQISVQNNERVNREKSNAWLHRQDYGTAISLMGSPLFFQETKYLREPAREQIRPLLAVYKQHRAELFRGFVFPVGDKPDDASWSGFQCVMPDRRTGYLLLFRELNNAQSEARIGLKFAGSHRRVRLTDMLREQTETQDVGEQAQVRFQIGEVGDYRFYRYELEL
jgi:hypothetical protein